MNAGDSASGQSAAEQTRTLSIQKCNEPVNTIINSMKYRGTKSALTLLLIAISKIIANLERVGDEAARVARVVQRLVSIGLPGRLRLPVGDLQFECDLAVAQLRKSLDAFARLDTRLALEVLKHDDQIDQEFEGMMRKLITYMMEDPKKIGPSTHLLFIAKNFERIGDHATNIAETISYIVTGAKMSDPRPKSDKTSSTTVDAPNLTGAG